ncbi:hypothetical protein [Anabaena sp. 4-3]|nr:hypothetical protein [Anabaena sp. 4-3]
MIFERSPPRKFLEEKPQLCSTTGDRILNIVYVYVLSFPKKIALASNWV